MVKSADAPLFRGDASTSMPLAACRADEQIEQLPIEPVRVLEDLMHLQPRLDVEVIADMTGLQVEIQQANSTATGFLGELDLHGGLEREGSVADPAAARHEGDDCGSDALGAGGRNVLAVGAGDDVENLLRSALQGYPVGAPAADQSLVVAGRNFAADEDEEDPAMLLLLGDAHDAVERGDPEHRQDDVMLIAVRGCTLLAEPAGDLLDTSDLAQAREPAPYSAFQLAQLVGFDARGKKIDLHQV